MPSFLLSCATVIGRRIERPGYGLLASIVPETRCPEVYKERGKELFPYPLFDLAASGDSYLLCRSPDYILGAVVMTPDWFTVATLPVVGSPQPVKPVAVTEKAEQSVHVTLWVTSADGLKPAAFKVPVAGVTVDSEIVGSAVGMGVAEQYATTASCIFFASEASVAT